MIPPLDHPANTLLLRWLAPIGVPVPALLHDWEVQLYTLLAAPDLIARMLALAGAGGYWALHGFPALLGDDGQVDVVAAGLSTLVVRCDERLDDQSGLVPTSALPPFGWVALDAWTGEEPLAGLVRAARLR